MPQIDGYMGPSLDPKGFRWLELGKAGDPFCAQNITDALKTMRPIKEVLSVTFL